MHSTSGFLISICFLFPSHICRRIPKLILNKHLCYPSKAVFMLYPSLENYDAFGVYALPLNNYDACQVYAMSPSELYASHVYGFPP